MKQYSPIILIIGLMMVAVGVMMPIMSGNIEGTAFRYVYAGGALLTVIARFLQPKAPADLPLRLKRLLRLESWSAIMFCVAAFFSFYDQTQIRDWLAFTLAGAAIQIYTSIAIAIVQRKQKK